MKKSLGVFSFFTQGEPRMYRLLLDPGYPRLDLQQFMPSDVEGDPAHWQPFDDDSRPSVGAMILAGQAPPAPNCGPNTFLRLKARSPAGAFRLAFPVELATPDRVALRDGQPYWCWDPFVTHRAFGDVWEPIDVDEDVWGKPTGRYGDSEHQRRRHLRRQSMLALLWKTYLPASYAEHNP